jgi:hypothetical protein
MTGSPPRRGAAVRTRRLLTPRASRWSFTSSSKSSPSTASARLLGLISAARPQSAAPGSRGSGSSNSRLVTCTSGASSGAMLAQPATARESSDDGEAGGADAHGRLREVGRASIIGARPDRRLRRRPAPAYTAACGPGARRQRSGPMPTLFEKIIAGELPADFVHRDERVVAFRDIHPQAPVHVLIVPVKPIPTSNDIADEDAELDRPHVLRGARHRARRGDRGRRLPPDHQLQRARRPGGLSPAPAPARRAAARPHAAGAMSLAALMLVAGAALDPAAGALRGAGARLRAPRVPEQDRPRAAQRRGRSGRRASSRPCSTAATTGTPRCTATGCWRGWPAVPEAEFAPAARAALARSLTAPNVAAEVAYLAAPGRTSFERPYGLAWLLQLAAELREWDDPQARALGEILAPLEASGRTPHPRVAAEARLPDPRRRALPDRLRLRPGADWARAPATGMARLLDQRRRALYLRRTATARSPTSRRGTISSRPAWPRPIVRRMLPPSPNSPPGWRLPARHPGDGGPEWLPPRIVTDRSDGKLAHIDGLNLSRAWMLEGIASGLPVGDLRAFSLRAAAEAHALRRPGGRERRTLCRQPLAGQFRDLPGTGRVCRRARGTALAKSGAGRP